MYVCVLWVCACVSVLYSYIVHIICMCECVGHLRVLHSCIHAWLYMGIYVHASWSGWGACTCVCVYVFAVLSAVLVPFLWQLLSKCEAIATFTYLKWLNEVGNWMETVCFWVTIGAKPVHRLAKLPSQLATFFSFLFTHTLCASVAILVIIHCPCPHVYNVV